MCAPCMCMYVPAPQWQGILKRRVAQEKIYLKGGMKEKKNEWRDSASMVFLVLIKIKKDFAFHLFFSNNTPFANKSGNHVISSHSHLWNFWSIFVTSISKKIWEKNYWTADRATKVEIRRVTSELLFFVVFFYNTNWYFFIYLSYFNEFEAN